MSRRAVLIHLSSLIGWIGCTTAFFRVTVDVHPLSVYETVHLGSFAALGISLYSLLFECVRACTPIRWGMRRRPALHDDYTDFRDGDRTTLVISGVPKLTMGSVWSLVYGLGGALFVVSYCVSGQQPVCSYCLALGLVVLCTDEAHCLSPDCISMLEYLMATVLGGMAVMLVVVDTSFQIEDTNLFGIVWGVLLPCLAPLTFWTVKANKRYTLGSVFELCEFGMPFASIIGLLYICVMDGERVRGLSREAMTNSSAIRPDTTLLLAGLASPWLVVPSLIFFASAILQSRSVDPLLAIATVMSAQHFATHGDSVLATTAICLSGVGLIMRIWSTESEGTRRAQESAASEAKSEPCVDA